MQVSLAEEMAMSKFWHFYNHSVTKLTCRGVLPFEWEGRGKKHGLAWSSSPSSGLEPKLLQDPSCMLFWPVAGGQGVPPQGSRAVLYVHCRLTEDRQSSWLSGFSWLPVPIATAHPPCLPLPPGPGLLLRACSPKHVPGDTISRSGDTNQSCSRPSAIYSLDVI